MADFVGAVDQGTTSTRFMIFDHGGNEVARHQLEHEQILPQAGWVEHYPDEIWDRTQTVISTAMQKASIVRAGRIVLPCLVSVIEPSSAPKAAPATM